MRSLEELGRLVIVSFGGLSVMVFASHWPASFQEPTSGEPALPIREQGLQIVEVYLFLCGHDVKCVRGS